MKRSFVPALLFAASSFLLVACPDDPPSGEPDIIGMEDTGGDSTVDTGDPDGIEDTTDEDVPPDTGEPDIVEDIQVDSTDVPDTAEPDIQLDVDVPPDTSTFCDGSTYSNIPQSDGDGSRYFFNVDLTRYTMRSGDPATVQPFDAINIELWYGSGASEDLADYAPFVFSGELYQECTTACSLAFRNCTGTGLDATCEQTFLISEGELTLTSLGRDGEQLTGNLAKATFIEVDVDEDFNTTLKENGETWCVESVDFDITVSPYCGDGILDGGEACDAGADNANTPDACRTDCKLPTCGDGIQDSDEGCDLGETNGTAGSGCTAGCQIPSATCGDGNVDSGEECDDGTAGNSNTDPDACREDCTFARCGDGVQDSGESCDEGINNGKTFFHCSVNCNPCTYDDVPNTNKVALHAFDGVQNQVKDRVLYFARSGVPTAPRDLLDLQIYYDYGASDQTSGYAPYTFTGEDYADCNVCLLAARDCSGTPPNVVCAKDFLVQSGTMTLSSIGRTGDNITGSLDDIRLELVTYNGFNATIVDADNNNEADESWCFPTSSIGPTLIEAAQ